MSERVNITEEQEKQLGEEFPLVFQSKNGNGLPMAFVFGGLPKGWFQIVYGLCNQIERLLESVPEDVLGKFDTKQVKEKFGGLCFYIDGDGDVLNKYGNTLNAIYAAIEAAESKASSTCEVCGVSDETVKTGGYSWIRTLCVDHREDNLHRILEEAVAEANKIYTSGKRPGDILVGKLDYSTRFLAELNAARKTGKH